MTDLATYRKVLELSMPAAGTDARREWLKAAMEVIADAVKEHSGGNVEHAMRGFGILASEYGAKRIAPAPLNPRLMIQIDRS